MKSNLKRTILTALVLLAVIALLTVGENLTIVKAQSDMATVNVMPTTGGTTSPAAGQYTFANGTTFMIQAIPDTGYVFSYWVISGDLFPGHTVSQTSQTQIVDPNTGQIIAMFPATPVNDTIDALTFTTNPANITCGFGYTYTYTAVFAPIVAPNPTPGQTDAVVVVMPTTGGTVSPAAGQYTYPNGTPIVLLATPNSGCQFSYWIISGTYTSGHVTGAPTQILDPSTGEATLVPQPGEPQTTTGINSLTFTANPANITCGYGYTYTYTAVFASTATPSPALTATASPTAQPTAKPSPIVTSSPAPSSGMDLTVWIVVIVVVVVVIIAVIAVVMMRRKKK